MDKVLVSLGGIALIGFIYWFFLLKREQVVSVINSTLIKVEGGYTPEVITIQNHQPVRLNFLRIDPSSCLEEIVIPDFHIRKTLPLGQKIAIDLMPEHAGEFSFSCGMGMYHGKIIVRE